MASNYDEDKAFERVMQACRAAEAKGWTIKGGSYFRRGRQRTCCPIGAYILETTGHASLRFGFAARFAEAVGLTPSGVGTFIAQIDNPQPKHLRRSRGARLARRLQSALGVTL